MASILKKEFLGKVANNEEGRSRVKGRLAEYFSTLRTRAALENFEAASDVEVHKGRRQRRHCDQLRHQPGGHRR